jgi:putative sugar O-methyltransferase
MLASLTQAKADMKLKLHSRHWDVFGEQFAIRLKNAEDLFNFRRSGLSQWFDDSNVETDAKKIANYYASLIAMVGSDFFRAVAESTIGAPRTVNIGGADVDLNDLFLVYYTNQIRSFVPQDKAAVIVEIGGGYGGLGVKLKRLFPQATLVFADLPEVNAVQEYYVRRNFPDAKILTYQELKRSGAKLDRTTLSSYDFVILPGWLIEEFADDSADLVINTRSMMEMDFEVIRFYFSHIQRILRVNGFFYCVNRYEKSTVGYPICIKDYPYDDRWYVAISAPSWRQPAIHVFGCVRTAHPAVNSARSVLQRLRPFTHRDVIFRLSEAWRIVLAMARDRLRESALVNFFVRLTGYQKFRETTQV